MRSTSTRKTADGALKEALGKALDALRPVALIEALLANVDVNVFQAADGAWHAHVLVDRSVPRESLPQYSNRPLEDSGTGDHWYDPVVGLVDYDKPKDDPTRRRTPQAARALLDEKVAALLLEICQRNLAGTLQALVVGLPHRENHLYAQSTQSPRE